nr:transcription antitermination factor NusB [Propionibacterium sp.]
MTAGAATPAGRPPTRRHGTRTKARKRALDILFEADLRGEDPLAILAHRVELGEPPVREFTRDLVEGVCAELAEIDATIAASLIPGWTLDRMPRVDRNLARIAVYEMWFTGLAPEIAVSEAVDLGARLSTDESPDFLNGLLGKALRTLRETYPEAARGSASDTDDDPDAPDDDESEDDNDAGGD